MSFIRRTTWLKIKKQNKILLEEQGEKQSPKEIQYTLVSW